MYSADMTNQQLNQITQIMRSMIRNEIILLVAFDMNCCTIKIQIIGQSFPQFRWHLF